MPTSEDLKSGDCLFSLPPGISPTPPPPPEKLTQPPAPNGNDLGHYMTSYMSGRFMYQSGRAGDEAKKGKSPAKSGRVGITGILTFIPSS